MNQRISRRGVIQVGLGGVVGGIAVGAVRATAGQQADDTQLAAPARPLLTKARDFRDVSRPKPHPNTLNAGQLAEARLSPSAWRLELVGEGDAIVPQPRTIEGGTAVDLEALHELGQTKAVRILKGMQCLNIPQPLGQGLWEGVPLRDVLALAGKFTDVRRLYYWGYVGDPPKMFRSSLSYTQAMESPPGEPPPLLVYKLNGEPLPIDRGGPVRLVVPWAYGFKSIKWLQKIVLTNDYQANDTYAENQNDPDSRMKTAAYVDAVPEKILQGKPIRLTGAVVSGLSGVKRVECWLRPAGEKALRDDDPAWQAATWLPARLDPPPASWASALPEGESSQRIWGFDSRTGQPVTWPLPYSVIGWSFVAEGLAPGKYELRARSVDLNDFAQPEPRPYQKSGRNLLEARRFEVVAS